MNACKSRLVKDLRNIAKESKEDQGIYLEPLQDDITIWEALIDGPENTIWEGSILRLIFNFPDNYPSGPPQVTFMSPIFHPNVYTNGNICLDILQNQWSTLMNASTVCMYIKVLLENPNPDSPANSEAAKLFTSEPELYKQKVRECVEQSWQNKIEYDWDDE